MKRRDFVKTSSVVAGGLITGCSKVYRGNRPQGVLKENQEGFVSKLEDLKNESATLVYAKRGAVIIVRKGENLFAYESVCPHTMCEINDGMKSQSLEYGEIRCWIHDSYFNAETGKYISGPANPGSTLPKVELRIEDGKVYLES